MKRIFDIICSAYGLLFLSPLLILISCMIKAGDGGPVFYRGVRVGLNGKLFRIYKFRTMVMNAEKLGGHSTADDDPRITKLGKFLRKYKLDELPQLINVLKGDMAVVGPRPEVKHYVDMYTDKEKDILSVRPGITDWASLWNPEEGAILAGSADAEKAYMEKIRPTKLKLQLKYIRDHSIFTDIIIIIKTLGKVIKRNR